MRLSLYRVVAPLLVVSILADPALSCAIINDRPQRTAPPRAFNVQALIPPTGQYHHPDFDPVFAAHLAASEAGVYQGAAARHGLRASASARVHSPLRRRQFGQGKHQWGTFDQAREGVIEAIR